jgi:hypothetical protein
MKSKSINDGAERTFVLILDQGEEGFKSITEFADREKISGASVTAIGAFSKAKVGWFDLGAKQYRPIEVNEQCEVLSLLGDVAEGDDGKASLHLHAVLGLRTAPSAAVTSCRAWCSRPLKSRSRRQSCTCGGRRGPIWVLR